MDDGILPLIFTLLGGDGDDVLPPPGLLIRLLPPRLGQPLVHLVSVHQSLELLLGPALDALELELRAVRDVQTVVAVRRRGVVGALEDAGHLLARQRDLGREILVL